MSRRGACVALALGAVSACAASAGGVTVQLDYRYDNGFFTNPAQYPQAIAAKAALENAAACYSMYLDHLSAIQPGGDNTWSARFYSPSDGIWTALSGLVVPADTIVLFVGARNLGPGGLGTGGPGVLSVSGTSAWRDTVWYRGQAGASASQPTDFGPWGGSITFGQSISWHFDYRTQPASGTADFWSVAVHELGHVFGVGTAGAWNSRVQQQAGTFNGPASVAEYGTSVPLDSYLSHWYRDVESTVADEVQEAAMTPYLTSGTRKRLTDLDRAALDDIGWEMPTRGDANHDGIVDGADYGAVWDNYGKATGATWGQGDFDGDGDVDWRDFYALRENFGRTVALAPLAVPTAPEPVSAAFAALSLLALLGRRGRSPCAGPV